MGCSDMRDSLNDSVNGSLSVHDRNREQGTGNVENRAVGPIHRQGSNAKPTSPRMDGDCVASVDEGLFPELEPAPAPEVLSAGRRLTRRQQQDVSNGVHPLMGTLLHPQATTRRHAPISGYPDCHGETPCSGSRDPFTCGTCVHRVQRGYAKCDIGPVSHGSATDVRAWWPACLKYEAVT